MQNLHTTKGYSLVEVLVAITILLIAIVGPMTIASKGLQSARFASEQNAALFMAQEGVEMVVYMRSSQALRRVEDIFLGVVSPVESWAWVDALSDCETADGCFINFDSSDTFTDIDACNLSTDNCRLYLNESAASLRGRYSHTSSGGVATPYTRQIFIEEITNDSVKVRAVVSWQPTVFALTTKTVEVETFLYNIYAF